MSDRYQPTEYKDADKTHARAGRFFSLLTLVFAAFFLGFYVCSSPALAQDKPEQIEPDREQSHLEKKQLQLAQIIKKKLLLELEIEKLKKSPDTKQAQDQLVEVQNTLNALNINFEKIATSLDSVVVTKTERPKLSWSDELLEITKPILNALREITEKPRKIDSLVSRIESLKRQIESYDKARQKLNQLLESKEFTITLGEDEKTSRLQTRQIKKYFVDKLQNLEKKYDSQILKIELEEAEKNLRVLKSSQKSIFDFGTSFITEFFQVRGRNLFVALGIFCLFWGASTGLFWLFKTKTNLLNRLTPHYRKFVSAVYNVFIIILASMASLFSLYLLNDWLILSILILLFIGVGLGFRHLIPKFVNELRLILNLGTVREGERLLWKGVPWLVQEIGVVVILRNPRLQGGILRLMVSDLVNCHSRPLVKDEDWFPSKTNDWVILSDDTFGQVLQQTFEQVVIYSFGSKKYYLTSEYLTLKPRNLSTGYRLIVKFGLDYGIQHRVCDELPRLFLDGIKSHFMDRMESDPPGILSVHVHFESAGESSLNLIAVVKVSGDLAHDYYPLKWELNQAMVQICNENKLVIPFTQLTISPSPEMKTLVKPSS